MTVASLWKALDRAGCGRAVGRQDIVNHNQPKSKINPWNYNQEKRSAHENRPTFAVDLSIWICESLTSTAMAQNHVNPALYLVYCRTVKLLNLGVKLVVVIEGKRRIQREQGEEGEDKFRQRRSGTAFWKACQRCAEMVRLLGVPVVRAVAEGEALCALLNQKGIVDGVISNDGDCLLFGAKVIYTKLSIENMENSRVVRYDASEIKAFVDDNDEGPGKENASCDIVRLTRKDLIAFALITGSDLAGNGFPKVGCRKALRFIRKCQLDNPLKSKDAAIEELESWARSASVIDQLEAPKEIPDERERRCSCCCHPGTKLSHQKYGCKLCGTSPGEPCFRVSPGGRFRKSLRERALAMEPKFDPTAVVASYLRPNDNQVPFTLVGKTSKTLKMAPPRLQDMLESSLIVKGRSLSESREYIRQSLGRLAARTDLLREAVKGSEKAPSKISLSRDRPIPQHVTKKLVRDGILSYEVLWSVSATMTDEDGNCVDGYEFLTVETHDLIKKCHPHLIEAFEEKKKIQGDGEQVRRRAFLDSFVSQHDPQENLDELLLKKKKSRQLRERQIFFKSARAESRKVIFNPMASRGEMSRFPARSKQDTTRHDCHQMDHVSCPIPQSSLPVKSPNEGKHGRGKRESVDGINRGDDASLLNVKSQIYNLPKVLKPEATDFDSSSIENDSYVCLFPESKSAFFEPMDGSHADTPMTDAPQKPSHVDFLSPNVGRLFSEQNQETRGIKFGDDDPLAGPKQCFDLYCAEEFNNHYVTIPLDAPLSPRYKRRRMWREIDQGDDDDSQEEPQAQCRRRCQRIDRMHHDRVRPQASSHTCSETSSPYFDDVDPILGRPPGRKGPFDERRSTTCVDSKSQKQAQHRWLHQDQSHLLSAPGFAIDQVCWAQNADVSSHSNLQFRDLHKAVRNQGCFERQCDWQLEGEMRSPPDSQLLRQQAAHKIKRERPVRKVEYQGESQFDGLRYDSDTPCQIVKHGCPVSKGPWCSTLTSAHGAIRSQTNGYGHRGPRILKNRSFDGLEAPLRFEGAGNYQVVDVHQNGDTGRRRNHSRERCMEARQDSEPDYQGFYEGYCSLWRGHEFSACTQNETLMGKYQSPQHLCDHELREPATHHGVVSDLQDRNSWFPPFRDSNGHAKLNNDWDFSHVEYQYDLLGVGPSTPYGRRPTRWQEIPEDSSSDTEMCGFERHLLKTQNAESTCSFNTDIRDFERHLLQTQHAASADFDQTEEWERVSASPTRFDAIEEDTVMVFHHGWDGRFASAICNAQPESFDRHPLSLGDHLSSPWDCTL